MDAFFYDIDRIQFKCNLCKDNTICYEHFHHISVPEFMRALFYGINRIQFKCNLCQETITFVMKIFIIFLFQGSWIPSFTIFIEFNLNVNRVKTITLVMKLSSYSCFAFDGIKIFIIFLFQSSLMPCFTVFIDFNLNVNCVKTIIFIIFLFQSSWMPSFTVFIEFNLNVNCVKIIIFSMNIFINFCSIIHGCLLLRYL